MVFLPGDVRLGKEEIPHYSYLRKLATACSHVDVPNLRALTGPIVQRAQMASYLSFTCMRGVPTAIYPLSEISLT